MKKLLIIMLIGAGIYQWSVGKTNAVIAPENQVQLVNSNANNEIQSAYQNRRSNVQLKGNGTVIKILRDDNEGSRHQKFILRLSSGQTLLIAHNIDLAPRINSISDGDSVQFYGEYEWNDKGGVIHWTHHDPSGRHVGGWLKHNGRTYQ
ncbi:MULTISPECIES: DUF3465 domain-containing protein [unclassified Neptuniibacter]|uniref:DUF3465 domain-containing protein n=1 Tax=unclassified Neptuniibacter TaxID=2630693 RepID=UPI000C3C14FE|nr:MULTISPECIES: DUF3465 domain-containing protein [unclassified Neptuniibacter]MAY43141.1 hypothetical protein [Oceanospirillaceae bacterium]|tara:strand:+ start:4005 stop:4451 length:447 start_codon:yes stop_codon:yes gene_type:complete